MRKDLMILASALFSLVLLVSFVSAQTPTSNGTQTIAEPTYCCEKTTNGLFCQDAPLSQCSNAVNPATSAQFLKTPTACRSTSYCKPGTCYDSYEGTCISNTPRVVCNGNNGTWAEANPAQCNLGCCVLGDQAAFVPLVRCKRLSAFLGVETNYKSDITDEVSCILSVQNQDKGACVYTVDFEKTCKVTTRADCVGSSGNGTTDKEFHKGKLCTAEELGTICGMTDKTTCLDGKEEVYFVDTCGNVANIYDSTKITDKNYWADILDKAESCNPNNANIGSTQASCGNCNYPLGSYCRDSKLAGESATYGDNICADLNCYDTHNGNDYRHGESWCVFDDKGTTGKGNDAVGSRFYKHICNNGKEVLEQCADYRQEECIQDTLTASDGNPFYQAACRVNRWQDCIAQDEQIDCENPDRRDCYWKTFDPSVKFSLSYMTANVSSNGMCLPKNSPGLEFWGESILATTKQGPATYSDYQFNSNQSAVTNGVSTGSDNGAEAEKICAIGNSQCIVTLQKGLFDSDWTCDEDEEDNNCQCLDSNSLGVKASWVAPHVEVCKSLGDCGPKVNWFGKEGYKLGYNVSVNDVKESTSGSSSGGGLFG